MRLGREINELEEPVNLTVFTLCPDKWVLIDTETGQSYRGNKGGYWDRLEPVERKTKDDE